MDEVCAAFPDRDIRLESSGAGDGEWDPDRLAQVLTNLLVNALTYSPPTEPVIVRTSGEDETVIVEVHNGGVPIAPALMPHLFEPYRRGESERVSNSSLGLGLFISREIVAAHQGTIDVRSSSEEGTTFTVRIPRRSRDTPSRH